MLRSFAVVPAAGLSVRMGTPKLLLPLPPDGEPLIRRVLAAWTASRVTRVIVVVRTDDRALAAECRQFDVDVVTPPIDPLDMKASVHAALSHIATVYAPRPSDAWLLAPADLPRLASSVIDLVLDAYDPKQSVAVRPARRDQRGHPALLPWSLAPAVDELADDEGVNALLSRLVCRRVDCDDATPLDDLDNPAEYARLVGAHGSFSS